MRRKRNSGGFVELIKENLFGIVLFAFVLVVILQSLGNAGESGAQEEKRIAEQSIRRAIVSCYAVEGMYPGSYEYLRDNYGVRIDEDKYAVKYEIFSANIMPVVTIIEVSR